MSTTNHLHFRRHITGNYSFYHLTFGLCLQKLENNWVLKYTKKRLPYFSISPPNRYVLYILLKFCPILHVSTWHTCIILSLLGQDLSTFIITSASSRGIKLHNTIKTESTTGNNIVFFTKCFNIYIIKGWNQRTRKRWTDVKRTHE